MEQATKETQLKQRPCRFYLKSNCWAGNRCPFLHDGGTVMQGSICKFYSKGRCRYGNACRFEHTQRSNIEPYSGNIKDELAGNYASSSWTNPPMISGYGFDNFKDLVPNDASPGFDIKGTDFSERKQPSFMDLLTTDTATLSRALLEDSFQKTDVNMDIDQPPLDERRSNTELLSGQTNEILGRNNNFSVELEPEERNGITGSLGFSNGQELTTKDTEPQINMEISPTLLSSMEKACSICFEFVMNKRNEKTRRFGILENCNHVFCVSCISKWRKIKADMSSTTGKCPECRVFSNFFVPSSLWIDDSNEKQNLIENYKRKCSKIPCKYFKQGRGSCLLGSSCLYRHTYPDGTPAILPSPVHLSSSNSWTTLEDIEMLTIDDTDDDEDDRRVIQLNLEYILNLFLSENEDISEDEEWLLSSDEESS